MFLFEIPIWSALAKAATGFFATSKFSITAFYTVCLTAGLFYALSLNVLGLGDHDSSGIDVGAHDVSHPGDLTSGTDHSVHFSPISPVTLSTFISSFGAVGLIGLKGFNLQPFTSAIVSAVISAVISAGVYLLFYKFFILSQASSVVENQDIIGAEAEVITPIPASGLGEIAYTVGGSRQTSPAKTREGNPIPKGSAVKVTSLAGSTCYVEEITLNKANEGGAEN